MWEFPSQLRAALRGLLRSPLYAGAVVATLALGMAALTAVFCVADAVFLRPLPYRQPERLVSIWETRAGEATGAGRVDGASFSVWREVGASFDNLAAFGAFGGTLTGAGEPKLVRGGQVTVDFFDTLGVVPRLGRFFVAGEDESPARVVVLGHRLWRERFGGSPEVLGGSVTLDGAAYTVIGVAPDLLYPSWPVNGPRLHFRHDYQDLWVPLPRRRLADRRSNVLGVVGRLAHDVTPAAARAALVRLAAGDPAASYAGVRVRPLLDEAVGDARPVLTLLLGAAALVLLTAVANAGGLVAARALGRRHELGLHLALGADLPALVRRQLAEALWLAFAAAAVGALLAGVLLPILAGWVPRDVPRLEQAAVDLRAVAVAAAAAFGACGAFALLPLALTRRAAPAEALRQDTRSGGVSVDRQRAGQLLVTAQVALAVALAIAATLLVESLNRLEASPLGLHTERTLIVGLELPSQRFDSQASVRSFYEELLGAVAAAPGALAAHLAYDHPLETNWLDAFALPGRSPRAGEQQTSELRFVTPGFFADLGIPLLAGREFVSADRVDGRPVAVVNRAFARGFFGDENPVGATLESAVATYTWGAAAPTEFEIVGVVGDVPTPGIERSAVPAFFLNVWQVPMRELELLVRTAREPELLLPAVRSAVRSIDGDLPLGSVRTLEQERRRAVAGPRFGMRLMTVFGATAMALAAVGVYGLLAGWVARRRREIGVRAALGARPGDQLVLVLTRGLRLAAAGIAAGVLAALALGRLLAGQLFGVTATDPGAIVLASAVVLAAALVACIVPAVHATRVDPARVLHEG
jgi:putative ABC transport system permease protein